MSRTINISDEELTEINRLIKAIPALSPELNNARRILEKLSIRCENEDDFANIRKEFEDETRQP